MASKGGTLSSTARADADAARSQRLFRAARRGDRGARERLVVAHLGLLREVAARYRDLGLPFDDLVQEGAFGLLEAVDRYDADNGSEFEAFARFRVRRAIRGALTERARLVRLPKHVVETRRLLSRVEGEFVAATGRMPTVDELATATGLAPAAVLRARRATITLVSLEELAKQRGAPLEPGLADGAVPDPEDAAIDHESAERVRAAVAALPERKRRVVSAAFGLGPRAARTADPAAELELSPQRARTIRREALYELRGALG